VDGPVIVLGLGNPGSRYRNTRHNLGFRVVDRLAERRGATWVSARELQAWTAEAESTAGRLVLAKPRTYMNRSGRAARALCARYEVDPGQLLVVYDDADLELGRLRLRPAGGRGGHRGMGATIDALQTEVIPRLRLGVRGERRDDTELADYVLMPFEPDEEAVAAELVERAVAAVEAVLERGVEAAMNDCNRQGASTVAPRGGAGESD